MFTALLRGFSLPLAVCIPPVPLVNSPSRRFDLYQQNLKRDWRSGSTLVINAGVTLPSPATLILAVCAGVAFVLFFSACLSRTWRTHRVVVRRENGEDPIVLPPLPVGKVPVWPYRPLDFLWAGFLCYLYISELFQTGGETASEKVLTSRDIIVNLQNISLVTFLTVLAIAWRIRPVAWLGLYWRGWYHALWIAPLCVILILCLTKLVSAGSEALWLAAKNYQAVHQIEWLGASLHFFEPLQEPVVQGVVKTLQHPDAHVALLMKFMAILVAPVCEEIIFRGYLYGFAKRFAGPVAGGLFTTLIFATCHANVTALLPLFLFGCIAVYLYERTGSILAPIAMHCCFNSLTVLVHSRANATQTLWPW